MLYIFQRRCPQSNHVLSLKRGLRQVSPTTKGPGYSAAEARRYPAVFTVPHVGEISGTCDCMSPLLYKIK